MVKRVSHHWRRAHVHKVAEPWHQEDSDHVHRACANSQRRQGSQETTVGPPLVGRTGGEIHSCVFETRKIRGLDLRDRIRQDKVYVKQHNSKCRVGANCWKVLHREFSQDVEAVTRLDPNDPKEIVSEILVEALDIATSTNLSMRSTEALQTFLQHCDLN